MSWAVQSLHPGQHLFSWTRMVLGVLEADPKGLEVVPLSPALLQSGLSLGGGWQDAVWFQSFK